MEEMKVVVNPSGEKVLIQTMELSEYINPGFQYTLQSIQSVIDLVKCRGTEELTFIFYTDKQIQVLLDDSKEKRQKDSAFYSFESSPLLKDWNAVIGNTIDQKKFIEFLKKRDNIIELPEAEALISALQTLKLATEVRWDGDYDDRNNYNFAIKVRDMEGNTRLPNMLTIHIPMINESDFVVDVDIELEVIKPQGEGQKPLFVLSCPKYDRYWKEAVKHEIKILKDALPNYYILAGKM